MANVLCAGVHPGLVHTRRLILERAGHTVVTAQSEGEIEQVCAQMDFDIAIISQIEAGKTKMEWLEAIRRHCPSIRVLEIYLPPLGPALHEADDWLPSPAEPIQLASRVAALCGKNRKAANL